MVYVPTLLTKCCYMTMKIFYNMSDESTSVDMSTLIMCGSGAQKILMRSYKCNENPLKSMFYVPYTGGNDLEINAKNKNIRELYQGIRIEMKGFQARTNIIKNENGDMLADAK
ncbi:hypothetical protein C0J52_12167, partial [Blattella germanica]